MGKRLAILLLIILSLSVPVSARQAKNPLDDSGVYDRIPDSAILPSQDMDFGEGLQDVLSEAVGQARSSFGRAAAACGAMMAVSLLCGILSGESGAAPVVHLAGVAGMTALFTGQVNALLSLGTSTIADISEYSKILLPVLASAMTAAGQPSSSAALYLGTAVFDTLLVTLIRKVLVPVVYVFLALAIGNAAVGNDLLKRMKDFAKGAVSWALRIILYTFTGYMTITGVMSGKADASAVKAAKLAISTAVPVVGGLLSDASEAVVLGAEVVRASAGLFGALAVLGICAAPFLRLGMQYLMVKGTAALCAVTGIKSQADLLDDFSQSLGMVLAMTGTCCLMQLISVVCLMKGAA